MKNIAIIDSGMGGLAVLARLHNTVSANYYYYADTLNMPYGNKTKQELGYILENIILQLSQTINIDVVIIACNTMTMSSMKYISGIFPDIVFFGCEPPVKQALQYTVSRAVTICTEYVSQHLPQSEMQVVAMPELATMIEQGHSSKDIKQYIEQKLVNMDNFDCIALGCTHYSHIKHIINQIYPAVKIFDSIDGVCARIRKMYKKKRMPSESTLTMLFSSNNDTNVPKYQKILQQISKYY